MEIIRCEGLSKIYQAGENKVFALDNVDLTIEQGSFTAITGPQRQWQVYSAAPAERPGHPQQGARHLSGEEPLRLQG